MDDNFNINPAIIDREELAAPRDPFADEWAGVPYVNDAGRLNLNKLLHLAPYSEVLLVMGPQGAGKSMLLQQFAIAAKKSWKVVHLRAGSLMTAEEFLRQIVHGFGLPAAGVDGVEEMLAEIGRYLQALGRSGRRAIIVVDDVHQLAGDVLALAEQILSDDHSANAISLVLAADDEAIGSRLDNFPVLLHKLAYTLQIEPLSDDDVPGYIRHRLFHSDNMGAERLFDEKVVGQICHKSEGLPGRINELARRHLDKKGGRKGSAAERASISGGRMVRWGLGLVGVAAIGAVLLFQDRINQLVETPVKEAETVVELPIPEPSETLAAEQAMPAQEQEGQVEMDGATAPQAELSMGALAAVTPESGAVSTEGGQPAAEPPPAATAAAVEPPLPLPPKPAVAQAPEKVSEAAAPLPPKVPEKRVQTAPKPDWLRAQDPRHFTLQLMALLDEAEVRQFVNRNGLEGKSALFAITRNGKRLTALVYGSYPDRAAADKAAASLPREWGVKGAWVRTFDSVVTDIKAN